jgi:hypothetical protein
LENDLEKRIGNDPTPGKNWPFQRCDHQPDCGIDAKDSIGNFLARAELARYRVRQSKCSRIAIFTPQIPTPRTTWAAIG